MPYIVKEEREKIDTFLVDLINSLDDTDFSVGTMNYIFSTLCLGYIEKHGVRYKNMNDIIGALECTKQEFYRRVVAPYEKQAIEKNGDIFE